jgi:hypothetical protein
MRMLDSGEDWRSASERRRPAKEGKGHDLGGISGATSAEWAFFCGLYVA